MGILSIFKKKKSSIQGQSTSTTLDDLPPIGQDALDDGIGSSDFNKGVDALSGSSLGGESKKLSAVEAFANQTKSTSEADAGSLTISLPDNAPGSDSSTVDGGFETLSVPNLDTTKELTYEESSGDKVAEKPLEEGSQNKDLDKTSTKNIFVKKESEVSESSQEETNSENKTFEEDNTSLGGETIFVSKDDVSFDDLPSFSEEDLSSVPPEVVSFPERPDLEDVSEIFVEKHKYAKMITSWKQEVDLLKSKLDSDKSFDHFDSKLQTLFTRSNLAFAQIQKKLLFAEKVLSQNKR
jgi:hypothetical protein